MPAKCFSLAVLALGATYRETFLDRPRLAGGSPSRSIPIVSYDVTWQSELPMADAWQTTPGPPPRSRGERNDAQNPRSSREALLTAPRTYTLATRPRTNQTSAPVGVASTNYNNTYVSANGTPYVPTSGTAQPSASYSVSYAPANPTTYSAISEDVQNAARGSQDSYYTQGTVTYSIAPQSQPRPRPQAVNPMDMPNV